MRARTVLTTLTLHQLEAENARLREALASAGIHPDSIPGRQEAASATPGAVHAWSPPGNNGLDLAGSQDLLRALQTSRLALAHSEARLRAIFQSAGDFAIIVTDLVGIITDWNQGAERAMDWTAAEMRGRSAATIFTPEDQVTGEVEREMRIALQDGRAQDERWHVRKGGERFWASGELMPLLDDDGGHIGFVKILRDRTAQREAATKQYDDAEFMRSVLASSADCIKVVDLNDKLTFMNEGGMRVMEISDFNSVEGCHWPGFWVGQGNRDAVEALAQARAGGVGHFQAEANTYLGTPKWWDVQVTPIYGPDGKPAKLLAVSRDISDVKAVQRQLAASEAYWRGLFERLSEGFVVGEVVRDAHGKVTDWRYVDVNQAWGNLVDIDPERAVGRTLREVFPGIEDGWVDEFANVATTGEPITFTRQVAATNRWYEGRAFPLSSERFGVIFLEVTDRVASDARREALLTFAERLRESSDVKLAIEAGAAAIGQALGIGRAGYGDVSPDGELFTVDKDWTLPGFPSLAGRYRMDDYGAYAEDLRQGRAVVITDVRDDPRTRDNASALESLSVRSLINLPVTEQGRTVAVLYVNDDKPRAWKVPEVAFARQVAELLRQATERRRAEDQQTVLNHELSHRLKNTLAIVQSIASQTLRGVSEQELVQAFDRRLLALSRAHDVLMQKSWSAAMLKDLMASVLSLQADLDRFVFDGPDLDVGPQAALSLSLLLHELATNALKYGSLSNDTGTVRIAWRTEAGEHPTMVFDWQEQGGPNVAAPSGRTGFGSKLIRMGLLGTRRAALSYESKGLRAEFRAPLAQVSAVA